MNFRSLGHLIGRGILSNLPQIIAAAEELIPQLRQGTEKKLTVTSEMRKSEGVLGDDPNVKAARDLLIDAQVAYLKAMEAAEASASAVGVTIPTPVQVPLRDAAMRVVQEIYAKKGYTAGKEEFGDLDNRLRNGQTLTQIVVNTQDDADRRFPSTVRRTPSEVEALTSPGS